jgi:hypothetical protein
VTATPTTPLKLRVIVPSDETRPAGAGTTGRAGAAVADGIGIRTR